MYGCCPAALLPCVVEEAFVCIFTQHQVLSMLRVSYVCMLTPLVLVLFVHLVYFVLQISKALKYFGVESNEVLGGGDDGGVLLAVFNASPALVPWR